MQGDIVHNVVVDSATNKAHPTQSNTPAPNKFVSLNIAVNASWVVNWFLLAVKAYATAVSNSKAVSASLADSAVDILVQAVLYVATCLMSRRSKHYPVGRSRLEALSVIVCACIMTMASVEVIQFSIIDLDAGFSGNIPVLDVTFTLYLILGIGIFAKFLLWIYCRFANLTAKSDMLTALAEDHINDVFSNSAAIITAAIGANELWYIDPIGAIGISFVIIARWSMIIHQQVRKMVGFTAPPEFIEDVENTAKAFDSRIVVDCIRAYYFGKRFNVELEIVLPGTMTVMESHDLALALQQKIEGMEDVERCFVHVDHLRRDVLEHKIERELAQQDIV